MTYFEIIADFFLGEILNPLKNNKPFSYVEVATFFIYVSSSIVLQYLRSCMSL